VGRGERGQKAKHMLNGGQYHEGETSRSPTKPAKVKPYRRPTQKKRKRPTRKAEYPKVLDAEKNVTVIWDKKSPHPKGGMKNQCSVESKQDKEGNRID